MPGLAAGAPLLDVFIPGRVTNPMNGSHGHWSVRAKWARGWRESAGHHIGWALWNAKVATCARSARAPKRITFTLHVWRRFDSDALGPCAKPCRDALADLQVVDSDGPWAPHEWIYEQIVDRKRPGVRIVVAAR